MLRHAAASQLSEVVLVLGHQAKRIADEAGYWGQRVVVNPDYADGQSTSLRAGLAAISQDAAAVLFLLGDQPQVRPRTIDALISAFQAGDAPIVVPTYEGIQGHPVLISRALFQDLQLVRGDRGAREVIRAHANAVHQVPVVGPRPSDVDTDEDYAALVARWDASNHDLLSGESR